jgi:SAM-dependent methyltransferase
MKAPSATHLKPLAAAGFAKSPEAYERGRPDYPPAVWDHMVRLLHLEKAGVIVEPGAGTGKFTRWLASLDRARILPVEPVPAMRRALAQRPGRMSIVGGLAEVLPIADHRADAVICAQCFHWFDGAAALAEFYRVLKPGGYLGLVWNVRDEDAQWVKELTHIMDPYEGDAPRYRSGDWKQHFAGRSGFSPLEEMHLAHEVVCNVQAVVDRVASISFIAALPEHDHARVTAAVRTLIATHPDTRGKSEFHFPYRADIYWCRCEK